MSDIDNKHFEQPYEPSGEWAKATLEAVSRIKGGDTNGDNLYIKGDYTNPMTGDSFIDSGGVVNIYGGNGEVVFPEITEKTESNNEETPIAADDDYNISKSTDDVSSASFSRSSSFLTDNATKRENTELSLIKCNTGNYGSFINQGVANSVSLDPLKKYMLSYYILNPFEHQIFRVGSSDGIDTSTNYRYMSPSLHRVVTEFTGQTNINLMTNGTNAIGDQDFDADHEFYMGGVQIEEIPELEKRYVVFAGDSTVQGGSGTWDVETAAEWSKLAGCLCNFGVYNRGIGGNKTSDIIARWVTDITPLAPDCKYCCIQGGINDISQGVAEQTIKDNIKSMYDLAVADGLIPVVCTVSPFGQSGAGETKRVNVNDYIKLSFPLVIDLDQILRSPDDESVLDPRWVGDGTHFTSLGKKVIANAIYKNSPFEFNEPRNYFPKA